MSESEIYSTVLEKAYRLEAENTQLKEKVANLTKWYDAMFGAPCEEIRHQQQVEALEAERDQLKAELAQAKAREARLREALSLFMACMSRYGDWDGGCFYYSRSSATELQIPIEKATALLKETGS